MNFKHKDYFISFVYIVVIILIIIASSWSSVRVDLTQDKRYTLSETTKEYLENLDKRVVLKVYLDGDMPVGLKRLNKALDHKLQEFRRIGGSDFQYKFIDPSAAKDSKRREKVYQQLIDKGVKPVNFQQRDTKGGVVTQVVFPGLEMRYGNKSVAVNLLKNNPIYDGDQNLNLSIENLEYELLNAMKTLLVEKKVAVGFVQGHNEAQEAELADIKNELKPQADVSNVILSSLDVALLYKCLVFADPKSSFSEDEKYIIDQYLLQGGNVLWFVDMVGVNADSLSRHGQTISVVRNLNIEDMFFDYGVRVNPVIVQDFQCLQLPINIAPAGQNAQFRPASWMYMPLATPTSNALTRGLNFIKTAYPSSIDFVNSSDVVNSTVLLQTSGYNRTKSVPNTISLYEINDKPAKLSLKHHPFNIAVMLEGEFNSIFTNRIVKGFEAKNNSQTIYKSEKPGKLIVVADADVIKNEVVNLASGPRIMRLGYDRYSKQMFDNLLFVKNVVNYSSGGEEVMSLRTNQFKMRLLDKNKTSFNRFYWQLFNVIMPIIIVLLAGVLLWFLRWYKYSKRR